MFARRPSVDSTMVAKVAAELEDANAVTSPATAAGGEAWIGNDRALSPVAIA